MAQTMSVRRPGPERGHGLRGCRRRRLGTCPRQRRRGPARRTRTGSGERSDDMAQTMSVLRSGGLGARAGEGTFLSPAAATRSGPPHTDRNVRAPAAPRRGDMGFAGVAAGGSAPVPGSGDAVRPAAHGQVPRSAATTWRRPCPCAGPARRGDIPVPGSGSAVLPNAHGQVPRRSALQRLPDQPTPVLRRRPGMAGVIGWLAVRPEPAARVAAPPDGPARSGFTCGYTVGGQGRPTTPGCRTTTWPS